MNDFRLDMPFTGEELADHLRSVNVLRKRKDALDREQESPAVLSQKIIMITEMQHHIGEIYAHMVYEHSVAYVERKNEHAKFKDAYIGTDKDKEAYADNMTKALRMEEAKSKSNAARWKNQYDNAEQRANAIKKHLEVVFDDFKYRGGRSGG